MAGYIKEKGGGLIFALTIKLNEINPFVRKVVFIVAVGIDAVD